MDKSEYQILRFQVENAINDFQSGSVGAADVTNNVMRLFLQAASDAQVRNAKSRRDLLTFRRNSDIKPPVWAYREPGISYRLPKL